MSTQFIKMNIQILPGSFTKTTDFRAKREILFTPEQWAIISPIIESTVINPIFKTLIVNLSITEPSFQFRPIGIRGYNPFGFFQKLRIINNHSQFFDVDVCDVPTTLIVKNLSSNNLFPKVHFYPRTTKYEISVSSLYKWILSYFKTITSTEGQQWIKDLTSPVNPITYSSASASASASAHPTTRSTVRPTTRSTVCPTTRPTTRPSYGPTSRDGADIVAHCYALQEFYERRDFEKINESIARLTNPSVKKYLTTLVSQAEYKSPEYERLQQIIKFFQSKQEQSKIGIDESAELTRGVFVPENIVGFKFNIPEVKDQPRIYSCEDSEYKESPHDYLSYRKGSSFMNLMHEWIDRYVKDVMSSIFRDDIPFWARHQMFHRLHGNYYNRECYHSSKFCSWNKDKCISFGKESHVVFNEPSAYARSVGVPDQDFCVGDMEAVDAVISGRAEDELEFAHYRIYIPNSHTETPTISCGKMFKLVIDSITTINQFVEDSVSDFGYSESGSHPAYLIERCKRIISNPRVDFDIKNFLFILLNTPAQIIFTARNTVPSNKVSSMEIGTIDGPQLFITGSARMFCGYTVYTNKIWGAGSTSILRYLLKTFTSCLDDDSEEDEFVMEIGCDHGKDWDGYDTVDECYCSDSD